MSPTLDRVLKQDWPVMVAVARDAEGHENYAASLVDFPGCMAQGTTRQEARAKLATITRAFFRNALELGIAIPAETKVPGIIALAVGFYDERTGGSVQPDPGEVQFV